MDGTLSIAKVVISHHLTAFGDIYIGKILLERSSDSVELSIQGFEIDELIGPPRIDDPCFRVGARGIRAVYNYLIAMGEVVANSV